MTRCLSTLILCFASVLFPFASGAQQSSQGTTPQVLAVYTDQGEQDHIDFAKDARRFFSDLAKRKNFAFTSTKNWDELTTEKLKTVQLLVWLNDFPHTPQQRNIFENFMSHGGAWVGFHVAAYNDECTHWAWFVDFLGGTVFFGNNWPPLPAKLLVDDRSHPITQGLPRSFTAPANEWYIWKPSARLNKDVRVLVTLAPENYPIGLKDTITAGDCPVVWSNTRYRMLYINMGHGDKIFDGKEQNRLFENAIEWLTGRR
jgi:type 1 glutamine amidotransferase